MNDYVTRLLAEAAQPKTPSISEQKQQNVLTAAAEKQAAIGGAVPAMTPQQLYAPAAAQRNGDAGVASASPMEMDMRNLSAFDLMTKYGDAGQEMINNRNAARNRTTVDAATTRDWNQTTADTISGIGMGVASGIGGIGALGLGIINKDAGLLAAEGLNKLTEFGQSTQSEALQAKRRLLAAENQQAERDSTQQFNADIASGKGDFMSSLSRIGRDVVSSVGNAAVDPTTLSDGIAQGVGSMIAISPVSRLLKGAGGAVEKLGTPLAIGGIEAGGSYQQTSSEIAKMPFDDLLKTSPEYALLVLKGMPPEEARATVANRAGLMSAAITLPAAVAAGKLVDGFASNPMKMVGGRAAVGNLAKETTEEGIQGGTGQLFQNAAIQAYGDNTKALSEGVGAQIGTGALYGLGTAGALQAPSMLASAGGSLVEKAANYLLARGDEALAKEEAASPSSINRGVEKTLALQGMAPQLQIEMEKLLLPAPEDTPEVTANKVAATAKYKGFIDSLTITEEEKDSQLLVRALPAIAKTNSRSEAIAALAKQIRTETDMNVAVGMGVALQTLLTPFMAMPDGVDTTTLTKEAQDIFEGFLSVQNSITEAPEVLAALKSAGKFFATPKGQFLMQEMNQTKESAMQVVAAAQMNPEATNPDVLDVVAKMEQDGTIQLTPQQKGALTTARTVMRAAMDYDTRLKAAGESRPKDIVAFEIKTEDSDNRNVDGKRSALQHANHITNLITAGDMAGAKAALELFGKFAQGQANKVAGINAHFAAGENAPHSEVNTLSSAAGFELAPSKTKMFVIPSKIGTVRFANLVTAEARFLAQVHNGLANAYRDSLGVDSLAIPELDAILQGNAADVVAEFKSGKRNYPQGQKLVTPATGAAVTPSNPKAKTPKAKKEPKAKVAKEMKIPVAIKKASTATIQKNLDKEMSTPGYQDRLRFKQLDAEMNLREDATAAEMAAQEEADALADELAKAAEDAAKAKKAAAVVATPAPIVSKVKPADVTPVVAEETSTISESVDTPAVDAPKTVAESYPNLVTPTKTEGTSLAKAFNLRKIASRFFGSASPIGKLKESLGSFEGFTKFMEGRDTKRKLSSEVVDYYRDRVPEMASKLVKAMNANLNAQLDAVPKNKGKTLRQLLADGTDVNDFVRGKVLSIAETDGKGNYSYNQNLVESAVLAGLDWFHNASNSGPIREEKDIAAILGIPEDDVSKEMLAAFNGGNQLLLIDVVPRIAQNITQFWGMKANTDYTQSATIGIPQAVATEVLMAMIRAKLIDWTPPVTEKTGEGKDDFLKSLHVFKLNQDALANPVYAEYPSFLSEMANSEVPETMYFGDALPPVAKTQMNNADVSLTDDQVKAVEAEQKTPFYINEPMFKLYQLLTKDGLLSIFGAGSVTPENRKAYNKTHLETVEGKNLSIVSAFDSLMNRSKEMTSVADAAGIGLKDVAVRFAYGISRVGRMQMLGRQNPQASKLVREALMPNQSTIDLTNQEDYNGYMLSIAQMLGVKVHTMSLEKSIAKVKKLLEGDLKDAVLLMQKYDATGKLDGDAVAVLQASIKAAGGTFMGLHAIVDYARLQNMIEADGLPSEYKTTVYVEADGVTNGPINAMVNLAVGKFTVSWLRNVAKGGLSLIPNQTMNKHREGTEDKAADNVDLYMKSTEAFAEARVERVAELKADTADRLLTPLARLMDIFIKDVTFNEKTQELELDRGVAKNPLTITIYGSGIRGIANKVTAELLDAIYAKMSEAGLAIQANPNMTYAEAMFGSMAGGSKTADSLYADFMASMSALTEEKVIYSKKSEKYMVVSTSIEGTKADGTKSYTKVGPMAWGTPQTFKVNGAHLQSLQENMMKMFVEPLRQGIEATVGPEVMASAQMIQVATNLQSIGLATQFKTDVYAAIAKHARPQSQFLSRNEQTAIMADLIKLYPTVKTQAQEFLIAGVSQSKVKVTDFSQALAGDMSMAAAVFAPDFAGVAGSPFLNIGMGDGLMMQLMATMKDAIAGTLKIFDGINMPVDKIKEGSLQANEAVSQTWQGNPMRAVANSFRASLPHLKKVMEGAEEKSPEYVAMVRSFGTLGMSDISFADGLDYVNSSIEYMADEIDARHTAMKRVAHSIDQMASAESPYQNEGEDLSGLTEKAQLARLNEMFKEELAKLRKITMARNSNSEELSGTPENVTVVEDLTNVANIPKVTMTPEGVMTLLRKLPEDLKESARQALLSPAMRGFNVIVGPREYINELTNNELKQANGVTIFGTKTIYLTSGSPEVLVHELLHAATMEKVLGVLAGTNKDKATVEAVNRLKILRGQFYKMEHNGALQRTAEQNLAIRNAINSMKAAKASFGEGVELNEFMAWATTNEALIELGKATTADKSALVQFTRKIIGLIRSLFFGSDYKGKLPKDFFNQVRFNNVLIARSNQPSAVAVAKDLVAYHSTAYGNNARLNEVETAYLNKMEPLFNGLPTQAYQNKIADHATDLANAVTATFPMSQQAKGVFQTVVGALATEAKLNAASLAKAQELYNHVTKQLTVESFMANPETNDPVDRYYAQEKYDLIMGKSLMLNDLEGRSSLMPVFLALGTVDDSFRAILAKMEMPRSTKNLGITLDDYFRNYGNNAMDALSNQLSGTKSTDSIKEALDGLQNNIVDAAQKKASILELMGNKVGGWVEVANDKAVVGLGKVAVAGGKFGDRLKKSNNKYVGSAGSIIKATSGLLSNDTAEATSEGLLSAMNSRTGLQPLRDFANDIIGRVASNASIYDMIKKVRSTVSSVRQEFRENVPLRIAKEFKTELTDQQWIDLNKAMAKSDMASLDMSFDAIKELVRDKAKMAQAIKAKEDSIKAVVGVDAPTYFAKSKQLADYMKTGVPGSNLLRNAEALARMFNEKVAKITVTPALIKNMDELVSLYAVRDMDQAERTTFNNLSDDAGLAFTFSYLKQQRKDETDKAVAHSGSKFNHYKGYIPSVQSSGMSLVIADGTQHAKLKSMSYVLVGSYDGAGAERFPIKKSYYFSNTPTRASFNQGIVQNVNITAGGVTATHGYSQALTAGLINEPSVVAQLTKRIALGAEKGSNEQLMPVFGANGEVIAYERSVDPVQLARLQKNDKLHQMLGVWRGRQIEEAMASTINDKLVDNMVEMYQKDLAAGRESEYVNIFDPKDPILKDALKIMPTTVRDYMANAVGSDSEFFVRRDMLFDAFGYRAASVGDAWTGNSRFSDESQKTFQRAAMGIMGNKAFGILTNGEKILSNFMSDARTTIVVKSVIVPVMNLVSNMVQLKSRGVPLTDILKKSHSKTIEVNAYVKNRLRQVDAEAELRAAVGTNAVLKLEAEIQSLKDAQKRMTIWPLIEAGEFTAISDVGVMHDDVDLSQGRWQEYIEKQVDKLPEAVRNAGRYAYITKDTALFQGLQKAVQYGDFIAKAIMYDDLVQRKDMKPEAALAVITEEFINYDRLPGRFRGYMEQVGLMWFYNFKLRSTKVAASMLRNNPVHALVSGLLPMPDVFGPIGTPIGDNVIAKALRGGLGASLGVGMGLRAPAMNPWWSMVN